MKENKQKIGLTEIARLKQVVHDLQTDEHVCDTHHKEASARARTAEHELNNANIDERACDTHHKEASARARTAEHELNNANIDERACDTHHKEASARARTAEHELNNVQTNTDKRFNELVGIYLGCASRADPRGSARSEYVDMPMGVFDAFVAIFEYIEEEN